ncbi:MAG: NAD(P)/FAD-dependent oxidoreductase [Tagaea sp.]
MRRIETEIAIFGAGIMGAGCAYELAKAGRRVALFDRALPASGTSGACDGFVSVCTKTPGAAMRLAIASQKLWRDWADELGAERFEYHRAGGLMLIEREDELDKMAAHAALLNDQGIETHVVGRIGMLEIEPELSPALHGALDVPGEAAVTPYLAVIALLDAARAKGVDTHWKSRPLAFDVSGGRIARVEIEDADGERVELRAERYVLCAGIWRRELGALAGLVLPVLPRRGELLVTARGQKLASRFLVSARYLTAKLDPELAAKSDDPLIRMGYGFTLECTPHGQHLIGNTRTFVGYDREVSAEGYRTILAEGAKRVPALAATTILRAFAGLRPFVPDKKPLLGASRKVANAIVAAGHEGDGITLAPVTARAVAALVAGAAPPVDLAEFSPDRFAPERAAR